MDDLSIEIVSVLFGYMAAMCVLALTVGIILLIARWVIFKKAGKGGWEAIVPIYNTIVLLQIAHMEWWYLLLLFVPVANVIVNILLNIKLAKAFGKSVGFAVGLIFLAPIFYPILAFSDATYQN